MKVLRVVTEIAAPVEACFDLSRSIDLHLESRFDEAPAGTTMTDVVEFRMGWGPLGPLADVVAAAYLRRLLATRNKAIRSRAEHG